MASAIRDLSFTFHIHVPFSVVKARTASASRPFAVHLAFKYAVRGAPIIGVGRVPSDFVAGANGAVMHFMHSVGAMSLVTCLW